jgi:hypothetical protein
MCNRFRGIVEIPLHELFDTGVRDVPPTWYPLLSKKRQLKERTRKERERQRWQQYKDDRVALYPRGAFYNPDKRARMIKRVWKPAALLHGKQFDAGDISAEGNGLFDVEVQFAGRTHVVPLTEAADVQEAAHELCQKEGIDDSNADNIAGELYYGRAAAVEDAEREAMVSADDDVHGGGQKRHRFADTYTGVYKRTSRKHENSQGCGLGEIQLDMKWQAMSEACAPLIADLTQLVSLVQVRTRLL